MKTDLKKIFSISGETGLFEYVSQAKSGIVARQLLNDKKSSFGINAKLTALSDVSIYTDEGELSLRELLIKLEKHLEGKAAMDHKSEKKPIIALFEEIVPTYDRDKFYFSHMRKIIQWYNILQKYASLDFVDPEEEKAEEEKAEQEKATEAGKTDKTEATSKVKAKATSKTTAAAKPKVKAPSKTKTAAKAK
ncbi:MAG: DUF5606 domain-containing protein [Bacteroidales bacterium]